MTPPLPLILIYRDSIDIVNGTYPLNETNLLGLLKHSSKESVYYDKEGKVWSSTISSDKYSPTFITKLLANTFYNPRITVKRVWEQVQVYQLQELKDKVNHCIDKNDDMLTQFVEGDILKTKVNSCKDFDALVQTLMKYVFQADEAQIFREFPIEE